jgi:hypothetical protein
MYTPRCRSKHDTRSRNLFCLSRTTCVAPKVSRSTRCVEKMSWRGAVVIVGNDVNASGNAPLGISDTCLCTPGEHRRPIPPVNSLGKRPIPPRRREMFESVHGHLEGKSLSKKQKPCRLPSSERLSSFAFLRGYQICRRFICRLQIGPRLSTPPSVCSRVVLPSFIERMRRRIAVRRKRGE